MQWLRLYTDVLDDPKVQRLPDHLFKTWINLLCLARRHDGKLPADIDDMAFALRLPVDEMHERFQALTDAGLFDDGDGTPEPHNWNGRQFKSDHDAAERMKRSRAKRALRNTSRNSHDDVTPPEQIQSRTDTEQSRKKDVTRQARDDTFEEFWKAYPHPKNRGSKRKARERWRSRVKDPPAVMRGVGHYAAYCASEAHWYSPKMAEGWLNGQTWENWQEPPKDANTRTIDADRIDAIVNGRDPDAGDAPCRDVRPALERPRDAGADGGIRSPPAPLQRR